MNNPENCITRMARRVGAVTSQLFRCRGLQHVPASVDRLGSHDLAYWIFFLAALTGWFLFLFAPQRERLGMLEDRAQVLTAHLNAERKEMRRLQRGIGDLQRGDPRAWERAARGHLGWVEPGEILDMVTWNQTHAQAPPAPVAPPATPAATPKPRATAVTPRPAIPTLPVAPLQLQAAGLPCGQDTRPPLPAARNARTLGAAKGTPASQPLPAARSCNVRSLGLRLAAPQ